ncbi:sensor domain-containing diguanylate cyclase [Tardiphaga alba]|uniref:diguanylate cyclase n=1 Tax=Tardiphaga alba TaxID=340268 RepID=A0ABX8A980_9BRAD|nr:GGDEF domain-containing protein [Tardiphaga alba]QUS39229.1 sensor domain-containing diguanylate cyclase [Tardiphaga alba]
MSAIASSSYDPVNGDFEAVEGETASAMLKRRLARRRQVMLLAAASHVINIALLLLFAAAGSTSFAIVGMFTTCAAVKLAVFIAISESGLSDRWKDHFFAAPYTAVTCAMMLGFIYLAPEVGIVFLSAFFLIANVIAFRASPLQGLVACILMTGSVAALYLVADLPLAVPATTLLERVGTLLTFAVTIGRGMFINIFASRMRDNLYRRGVELEGAYKRIEELAELDDLTGALNRRSIMQLLEGDIARTQGGASPCTVALIDLDWFKRINDRFGHLTGDEVLRTFAITIFANIRSIDKFGRFGGEEFLLILPDTPHDQAVRMLERLRSIIETLDWSAFSGGLTVTISAGVATHRPDEAAESMLARADSALYAAKESGRNRIAAA